MFAHRGKGRDERGLMAGKPACTPMGVTRWSHGRACVWFAIVVFVLACVSLDGVGDSGSTRGLLREASQGTSIHAGYRQLLAADYDATAEQGDYAGDYTDAVEEDAVDYDGEDESVEEEESPEDASPDESPEADESSPPSPARLKKATPPPKLSPKLQSPPKQPPIKPSWPSDTNASSVDEESKTSKTKSAGNKVVNATKVKRIKAAKAKKDTKEEEEEVVYTFSEEVSEQEVVSPAVSTSEEVSPSVAEREGDASQKEYAPPSPLSQAEFMAQMEQEWNSVGEEDGDDSGEETSSESEGEDSVSADDDGEGDEEETAGEEDVPESSETEADAFAAAIASAQNNVEETTQEEPEQSEVSTQQREQSTQQFMQQMQRNSDETAELAESKTREIRNVGVASDFSELPNDRDSRSHKKFLVGFGLVFSTVAFAGVVYHAKVQIDNARPHSSLELGSGSFKRPISSGVPIKYAKLGDNAEGSKAKNKNTNQYNHRIGAPPATRGLDIGGGTALFGDQGSGPRGKSKNARETTREEDDFYG